MKKLFSGMLFLCLTAFIAVGCTTIEKQTNIADNATTDLPQADMPKISYVFNDGDTLAATLSVGSDGSTKAKAKGDDSAAFAKSVGSSGDTIAEADSLRMRNETKKGLTVSTKIAYNDEPQKSHGDVSSVFGEFDMSRRGGATDARVNETN